MIYRKILFGFLGLALTAPLALAQDAVETLDQQEPATLPRPSVHGPMTVIRPASLLMVSFDTNNDYRISRAELNTGAQSAFAQADTGGDQSLTLFELEDWRLSALGSLDAMPGNLSFDENYNGRVTFDEFKATLDYEFTRADKDEDGVIKFSDLVFMVERPPVYEREERERDEPVFEQTRRRPSRF